MLLTCSSGMTVYSLDRLAFVTFLFPLKVPPNAVELSVVDGQIEVCVDIVSRD